MFNLQGSEIIFILLIALVVLGPEKLPDAVRRFTRTYHELKRMGSGFQSELRSALDEPMNEVKNTASLLQDAVDPAAMVDTDKPKSAEMKPAHEMGSEADADETDDDQDDSGPDLLAAAALGANPEVPEEPDAPPRNSVAAANSSAAINARHAANSENGASDELAEATPATETAAEAEVAGDVDDRRDEAAHR